MIGKSLDGSTRGLGDYQKVGGYINDVAVALVGSGLSSVGIYKNGVKSL